MEYDDGHCLTLPLREIDRTVNERLLRVTSIGRPVGGMMLYSSTLAKVFIDSYWNPWNAHYGSVCL